MNHESDTKYLEAEMGHGDVFEATNHTNHERQDDSPEAGADAVNVGNITCVNDVKTVDSLEVIIEV